MTTTTQSASLHYREGNSDNTAEASRPIHKTSRRMHTGMADGGKVYHAAIEPKDDGYIVTFAYGRRGNTLNTGIKTTRPVTFEEAECVFDKLVKSKLAKGYHFTAMQAAATPYRQTGDEGRDTGIRCQLLNPVESDEVNRLITSRQYCLQEKHDGRRLLVRKQDNEVTGINRRGLVVAIPDSIREAIADNLCDVLIDGEAVGDTLHAFDLLEFNGSNLRQLGHLERFKILTGCIPPRLEALRWTSTSIDPQDKIEIYEELRITNREGVVFKDIHAPYSPGRPNSGGPQLKFKFVESASFIVTGINLKRSVTLGLYDGDKLVSAGNVTIPPNHQIPEVGEVCEVRYLYAFKESGSLKIGSFFWAGVFHFSNKLRSLLG